MWLFQSRSLGQWEKEANLVENTRGAMVSVMYRTSQQNVMLFQIKTFSLAATLCIMLGKKMYDKKLILNLGFTELLAGFDDFAAT